MANTYSISFTKASAQSAYANDSASLSVTGDITIEAWIRLAALPSASTSDLNITTKWDSSNASYKLSAYKATDKLTFVYSSDGTTSAGSFTKFTCDTAFVSGDVGAFKHVAVAVDVSAQTAYYYFNGSSVNNTQTNSGATSIYDGTAKFMVSGSYYDSGVIEQFAGLIDELRVWNDIRTSTEISTNYQKELVGNEQGLVAYYKFNNNANDSTSNANNLTLINSPTYSSTVPFVGSSIKSISGVAYASLKKVSGVAIGSVKKVAGLG